MKNYLTIAFMLVLFASCNSFPEYVKEHKEKYIQAGKNNSSAFGDLDNLVDMISQKNQDADSELKDLRVEEIQTDYKDSFVLFINGSELVAFNFGSSHRTTRAVKDSLKLSYVEKLDDKLYFGKK